MKTLEKKKFTFTDYWDRYSTITILAVSYTHLVLDVIHAYSKACGKELPYVIDPRRPGDIAECYADPRKAKEELGWEAQYGIEEMCASSWKWQSMNPDGYKG